MAKGTSGKSHKAVVKTTCQNGSKTSSMTKTQKRNSKAYRGQGR
jgi:hypothetical protein